MYYSSKSSSLCYFINIIYNFLIAVIVVFHETANSIVVTVANKVTNTAKPVYAIFIDVMSVVLIYSIYTSYGTDLTLLVGSIVLMIYGSETVVLKISYYLYNVTISLYLLVSCIRSITTSLYLAYRNDYSITKYCLLLYLLIVLGLMLGDTYYYISFAIFNISVLFLIYINFSYDFKNKYCNIYNIINTLLLIITVISFFMMISILLYSIVKILVYVIQIRSKSKKPSNSNNTNSGNSNDNGPNRNNNNNNNNNNTTGEPSRKKKRKPLTEEQRERKDRNDREREASRDTKRIHKPLTEQQRERKNKKLREKIINQKQEEKNHRADLFLNNFL